MKKEESTQESQFEKDGLLYYRTDNYALKMRMYPNKEQSACIDRIINGVKVAYNNALYDMLTNGTCTKEFKTEKNQILHYADFQALAKKEYLDKLRSLHPDTYLVPGSALSSNKNGIFFNDMKTSLKHRWIPYRDGNGDLKFKHKKELEKRPLSLEEAHPDYYCHTKPRTSYTYQARLKHISISENNKNVLYITLTNVGHPDQKGKIKSTKIKIKGWNQKIRFQLKDFNLEEEFCDFVTFYQKYPGSSTITVSKDNLDQYWLSVKLTNVYLLIKEPEEIREIGIDAGVKDIITTSERVKYPNQYYKKAKKRQDRRYHRKLSRRQGWANEEFRKAHKKDHDLMPSKGYQTVAYKLAKMQKKIANQRANYNHNITKEVVVHAGKDGLIGIETLQVSNMWKNKHLSKALGDAAMSNVLTMIKYKGEFYQRNVVAIGRWEPSSKTCSCCGYVIDKLPLQIRNWTCPACGANHDRDENAAENISVEAKRILTAGSTE